MKKLSILAIVLFSLVSSRAQTINGVKISELKSEYIEIIAQSKMMSKKVSIKVDFGQEIDIWKENKTMQLRDKNGQAIVFNSIVGALNFFAQYNYEFIDAYTQTDKNTEITKRHYLLRRKK